MNLTRFFPVLTVAAISCLSLPAQAFSIGGNPSYTSNGLPNQLSVSNEVQIPDGDTQFTVSNPSALKVGSLFLEGDLGEFGIADNSGYTSVSSYIVGFEFLGEEAVFNLNAGENALFGFANGSIFTLDSELSGDIVDLDGTILGTAVGSLSSVQPGNQVGNFSLDLDGTPISLETTDSQPVPDPSLLFGLMGFSIACRGWAVVDLRNNV